MRFPDSIESKWYEGQIGMRITDGDYKWLLATVN